MRRVHVRGVFASHAAAVRAAHTLAAMAERARSRRDHPAGKQIQEARDLLAAAHGGGLP